MFSASNDGTVRRWDVSTLPHQRLVDLPAGANSAAIAPDGERVAVGFSDGSIRLYSLPAGRLLGETSSAHGDAINRLAFNRDGNLLASASHDDTAKLWDVTENQTLTARQTYEGHEAEVYGLAFSPDGRTLATASYDGRVGLFAMGEDTLPRFFKAHEGRVASVAFDASGTQLLSAGIEDKTARLWDLTNDPPGLVRAYPKSPAKLIWATLSPDGEWMVEVGRNSLVHVYSTNDGRLVHELVGHQQSVFRAEFSPDSQQLATVSTDATIRLWDVSSADELWTIQLPSGRSPPTPLWDFDFRCTPNGCWIAVPLTRGKLALYDLGPYAQ